MQTVAAGRARLRSGRGYVVASLAGTDRTPPLLALALVALALLGSAACQAHAQTGPQQVRGLVVNVQAQSIAVATAVTVRTEDGRELTIRVDPSVDVTPGHLREHMTLAQPVLVTYEQTPDGLLATRIDDA